MLKFEVEGWAKQLHCRSGAVAVELSQWNCESNPYFHFTLTRTMKTLFRHTFLLLLGIALLASCDEGLGEFGAFNDFGGFNGDEYQDYEENPFVEVASQPISTFSIDADGASYANIRRFIQQENALPPKAAVRTEELINYFDLDYDFDATDAPISLNGEVGECPWTEGNKLIRIGIQGKPFDSNSRPSANFVLLLDVSGSMHGPDRLDLLKQGFAKFVDQMLPTDRLAIVTYAGSAGVPLPSTAGTEKAYIQNVLQSLESSGSTAGAQGIITAYKIAEQNFIQGGNNRIIMGTDGDFNVGISSQEELVELIEEKRDSGVFLTVLGVGRGNYAEATLEQLANKGNGTFEYIDKVAQMEKVFIHEYSKFFTVAKDVKVQVEFNPDNVKAYRLIGYENRLLENEDFENDSTDAGEIGAGQNITALYEIQPQTATATRTDPTFTIDFRYKLPDLDISEPLALEVFDEGHSFEESSPPFKWCASVASYAMLLRNSPYKGTSSYESLNSWLRATNLPDPHGYKQEFRDLVNRSRGL